jgi:hypothetical protein
VLDRLQAVREVPASVEKKLKPGHRFWILRFVVEVQNVDLQNVDLQNVDIQIVDLKI